MSGSAFPILTFNEGDLAPTLGYVFDPGCLDPYESLVCLLWKFAWINRLPGHLVVNHAAKRLVDPYDGIPATLVEINVPRIASSLHVSHRTLRMAIRRADSCRCWCPNLQFCPRCMARGYHSVVHQFGHQQRCPVHGCLLETTCRSCGAASAYRIDAKVIGSPFRCPQCGSHYSRSSTWILGRARLPQQGRTAITRSFFS